MFDRLLGFLNGNETASGGYDATQLAVAALLVEAAQMDAHFAPEELAAIERILAQRFGLNRTEVLAVLKAAEHGAGESVGLFRFTRQIVQNYGLADRVAVIEMLWEVAYADGVLDPEEDMLIRRIAGLIHVEDHERGAARLRVLSRIDAARACR